MNKTELLVKLIALANNNPNDNEANLAARKVCKLLAELKVNFIPKKQPVAQSKPTTWNDVVRSTEPNFRSSRPTSPGADIFEQFFGGRAGGGKSSHWYDIPIDFKFDPSIWQHRPEPTYTAKPERKRTEKRLIQCVKCKKEFMSGYIGNLFICHGCHWEDYETNKK